MKAFLLLGLVLLVAISGYGGAQLRVDQAVYDFGEVTEGYVVNCTFLIANVGDAPAKFTYPPITSCGCTTAPLPKQELAPGESMELPVLFDSSGYGGKEVTETVTLYVEGESPLRLVLQGYFSRCSSPGGVRQGTPPGGGEHPAWGAPRAHVQAAGGDQGRPHLHLRRERGGRFPGGSGAGGLGVLLCPRPCRGALGLVAGLWGSFLVGRGPGTSWCSGRGWENGSPGAAGQGGEPGPGRSPRMGVGPAQAKRSPGRRWFYRLVP